MIYTDFNGVELEPQPSFQHKELGKNSNDLSEKKFGNLKALYRTTNFIQPNGTLKSVWVFSCKCGNVKSMLCDSVTRGLVKSCGKCNDKNKPVFNIGSVKGVVMPNNKGVGNTKHRLCGDPLYHVWASVLNRCYDPNGKGYIYYGGKGIKVCDRWLNVENFIKDNVDKYAKHLTIDRIDTNGNYEPDNVRWITLAEQAMNTGPKHWGKVKYKGVCWCPRRKVYRVNCYNNKRYVSLGHFNDSVSAANHYDEFVYKHKGELAWLNRNYFEEVMVFHKNLQTNP